MVDKRKEAMEVERVLQMNGGEGETSYAYNSTLQRAIITNMKPVLEEAIQNLCKTTFSQCLRIADLGCSSGPNTLLVITEIIDATYKTCSHPRPSIQVFLNDLPQNDFNTIFRSLPSFYNKLKKENGDEMQPCFITGVPGSFYTRLFPSNTLDFVHSSCSVHFLSQVPQGLESEEGLPLNKGDINLGRTSPSIVREAYWKQFKTDFSSFLALRSNELVPGGGMLLSLAGKRSDDPLIEENCNAWKFLASALADMVREGLVEDFMLDSFNVPFYEASANEIKELVQAEGSFNINRLETFDIEWDCCSMDECDGKVTFDMLSTLKRAQNVARCIRAASESMLVSHFGEAIIDDMFNKFFVKAFTELQVNEELKLFIIVVSLTKKT